MTNDENSVLDDMKGWLRDRGITKSNLKSYKYYLPYLVGNGRAGTPQSVTFELTLRCNLSCQMCPLDLPRIMHDKSDPDFIKSRQQAELSTEEVKRVITDIAEMGVGDMTITGGEVFLRKDVFEIVEHITATPIHLCINTNGWFLRPDEARQLVSLKPHALSISIDGPDDLHDEIRRGKGSFRRLLEGIRNVQEAKRELGVKRPKIGITVTVSALNQHRYSEVLDWLKDTGVDTVDFDYMFYTTPEHNEQTEKLIPLPVHHKEEDQDLPMYLRQVDGQALGADGNTIDEKTDNASLLRRKKRSPEAVETPQGVDNHASVHPSRRRRRWSVVSSTTSTRSSRSASIPGRPSGLAPTATSTPARSTSPSATCATRASRRSGTTTPTRPSVGP